MANVHALEPGEQPDGSSRILIVDDEPMVRDLIAAHLSAGASTGEEALALLDREPFDLVMLDVRLPGMSGFDTCRQIRARSDVPIVFVTAAGSLPDRLEGFDLGADDYVVKPMDGAALNRRVRAVLRRRTRGGGAGDDELTGPQGVSLLERAYQVFVGENAVQLTPKEFSVLRLLLERRGEVLATDVISTEIRGFGTFGSRNFVEAHVSRLRSKLAVAGASDVVGTVRGIGYVIR
jgi:DNA-binding response OmpR family regulator